MKKKGLVQVANDAIEKRATAPTPVPELPGYVTEAVLATRIGLRNKKSMWRYRHLGMGPTPTKIGRLIYYAERDIAEWLERCRQPKPVARVRRRRGTSLVPQRQHEGERKSA
jgi:hypothetical protein